MLCAPIPVSEAVLFYVNAPFSAGLAGCRSQHPALRGRPYFAAGPAPAGTPCARSERRGARRTFPAGKAKRPPFGREPRGQHCLQRACHFTQDMPQTGRASRRGLRAGPAPPAGTPCAHSERCGAGRRSENDARRGTYFAGPVRLRALRAALSFARFLRWGYRLPRRAVLWYNMST